MWPINKQRDVPWPSGCTTSRTVQLRQLLHMRRAEIKTTFKAQPAVQSMRRLSLFVVRKHGYSRLNTCWCTDQIVFHI